MIIGIDASRAYIRDKTGTENYSYHLITQLLRLPDSQTHSFVLFIRPNAVLPKELDGYSNVSVKEVKWRYLWTQVGLAWQTWQNPQLDVLWVPAHTLPVLRNPSIKTVVTVHGLEYQWLPQYHNFLQRWYLPLSTYYAARSADRLIAVSKFTRDQLIKELHTSTDKIKVIHEGVRLSSRSAAPARLSKAMKKFGIQDKKYILFVGTIQPRKNLPALIAAFARLDPGFSPYKLVIAGGVGWMAEEVFGAVVEHNVQDRVIFTGRVSQVALEQLYGGAAVYVQPSITEGFGLPVLEAMQWGVPVVSSDGGALGEVVGGGGILVKMDGSFVSQLTGAIKRVLRSQKLQKELISMGHKRVKVYGWDKAAKATLSVLIG